MNRFRTGLMVFAITIMLVHLITMDYVDFSWESNGGNYLGIFSMTCIILSMILSNRYEKKRLSQK
jgi:hypothetical protein